MTGSWTVTGSPPGLEDGAATGVDDGSAAGVGDATATGDAVAAGDATATADGATEDGTAAAGVPHAATRMASRRVAATRKMPLEWWDWQGQSTGPTPPARGHPSDPAHPAHASAPCALGIDIDFVQPRDLRVVRETLEREPIEVELLLRGRAR